MNPTKPGIYPTIAANASAGTQGLINQYETFEGFHQGTTGRFPATSTRENQSIMVLVEVYGNYIDTELMKNKTETEGTR